MSQKRKRSPESVPETTDIFRSEPIEDRSSTFIGYYSPTIPAKQLQSSLEFKNASHKILGWRKQGNQRLLVPGGAQYDAGHDDDGEKYGGKKVEKVLENMNAVGACVVARWYGGVMLGPVRFTHMEECARNAVRKWQMHESEHQAKKQKAALDEAEHARLVAALVDRDQSITVLRSLAAEKEEAVKNSIVAGTVALDPSSVSNEASATPPKRDPAKTTATMPAVDYAAMPVERLRALDKARDATLSFLLRRIDKAEADLIALGDPG